MVVDNAQKIGPSPDAPQQIEAMYVALQEKKRCSRLKNQKVRLQIDLKVSQD